MSASWEIVGSNRVLVGILHTEQTTVAWSFGLRNLIIPGQDSLRTFHPFLPVAGMPYDHARNCITQAAMDVGASHVFMLDSDVIPPRDTILRLLSHNLDFVSGMYFRRSPPAGVPVAQKWGTWLDLKRVKPGALVDVDLVGAGCLLLSRRMLEKLPEQRPGHRWWDWKVNYNGTGLYSPEKCLSEDFTLCRHAVENNFRVVLDSSVVCKHVGHSQAVDGGLVPCETAVFT